MFGPGGREKNKLKGKISTVFMILAKIWARQEEKKNKKISVKQNFNMSKV